MAASKHFNSHKDDINSHTDLSVRENFNHPVFFHKAFRSVIFCKFSDRVNKWKTLCITLPSKEGHTVDNANGMLS